MGLITPTLPTIGEPRGDGETDVRNTLNTLVTLVNGNLDAANMADSFATDVVEPAFSNWKPLERVSGIYPQNRSSGSVLGKDGSISSPGDGIVNAHQILLPLAATELAAGSRTTQLRIVADVIPNTVAPNADFTVALYAPTVTRVSGGAALSALGSAITGSAKSSGVISTTGAVPIVGDPFAFSSSGLYVIAVTVSASTAVGSNTTVIARLQYRQV